MDSCFSYNEFINFYIFALCDLLPVSNKEFKMYYDLFGNNFWGDCVMVPILNLSLCPSYYDFSCPSIDDVSIVNLHIHTAYSAFSVTNKLTNQTISIPTTTSIGLYTRYKLNKILKQPFNAYVLVTHQGFASVLNPQF